MDAGDVLGKEWSGHRFRVAVAKSFGQGALVVGTPITSGSLEITKKLIAQRCEVNPHAGSWDEGWKLGMEEVAYQLIWELSCEGRGKPTHTALLPRYFCHLCEL